MDNRLCSQVNAAAVLEALAVLHEPGEVVELRVWECPRKNAVTAGFFDDFEKLASAAAKYSGKAPGVYVTLNPVKPELLGRLNNRVEGYAKDLTTDKDVLRRRWLPLDFDSVTPVKKVPATDAEHELTLARARECRDWLAGHG